MKDIIKAFKGVLKGFRGLLSLLTTLPVGYTPLSEAASIFYLVPLAGLLEGLLIALVLSFTYMLGVEGVLMGGLYVLAHLLITGGIHLDGFADYSDVLGSRAIGSRAQAILKDPRRGSYAIAAVAVNIALSLASVHQLTSILADNAGLEGVLALATVVALVYVVSAESMFFVLSLAPPEPYDGMARLFSVEASRLRTRLLNVAVYAAVLAILSLLLIPATGFRGSALTITSVLVVQALAVLFTVRDSMLRLGFASGDVSGFSFELTRVSSLTVIAVILGWYLRL